MLLLLKVKKMFLKTALELFIFTALMIHSFNY